MNSGTSQNRPAPGPENAAAGPLASLDYDALIEGVNRLIAKLFSGLMHTRGDEFWQHETLNIGMVHIIVSAALGARAGAEPLTPAAQDLYHLRTHEATVLNLMLLHRLRTGRLPPDASRLMGQKLQQTIAGQGDNPFQRNVRLYRGVIQALVAFFAGREGDAVQTLLAVYEQALAPAGREPPGGRLPLDDRKLAAVAYRVILGLIARDASFGEATDAHDLQAASDVATVLTAAALAGAAAQADGDAAALDALLQVIQNVSLEHLQTSSVQRARAIAQKLNEMNPAEQTVMLRSLAAEPAQVAALSGLLLRAADGADVIAQITDLVQAISTAYWRRERPARQKRQ